MKTAKIVFWIFNFLSIFFILQIGLGIIPKFSCSLSKELIFGINTTLVNLSFSYIAGVIMFIFISFIPELKKKEKTTDAIQDDINLLVKEFYFFLFYMNCRYIRNDKFFNIPPERFRVLTKFSKEKMAFRYAYQNNEASIVSVSEFPEFDYFLLIKNESIKTIDGIFLIPYSIYIDPDLILVLRNIRNCKLFSLAESKAVLDVENFHSQFFEFYSLFIKLKPFSKNFVEIIEK